MMSGDGIDQLGHDAQAVAGPLDTSLQHIPHTQFLGHLLDLDRFALVGEGGVPGDHEQVGDL